MNSIAILLVVAVAACSAQRNIDPKTAAILAEARYLQGDGSFGAAYVQEDGVEFKEETGQNGERKGQYSYIDPNGKKITVHYTAGKNGFQVSGDHLPKAPAPLPAAAPAAQYQPRPQQYSAPPQYNPAPQHNAIQYQQPAAPRQSYPSPSGADDDGQYRPELHEFPYQYKDDGTGGSSAHHAPSAPAPQHFNQGFNYQHQGAGFAQNNYQQQPAAFAPQQTTPQPSRFFPPGQLDLNRTPDGFNFQFQSRQ